MKVSWLLLVVCGAISIGMITALTKQDVHDWQEKWRTVLCEKADDAVLQELEDCSAKGPEDLKAICDECKAEAFPESKDPVKSFKAGCADRSIFDTYDKCMESHIEEQNFSQKLAESKEALECCVSVMKTHGLFSDELVLKL